MEPIWLTKELIHLVHDKQILIHGGTSGIRDESLIDSALAKAQQHWNYQDPRPDIFSMAAVYAYGIVKNHAYLDGNKRTAHIAYRLFLKLNGYDFTASATEKYANMIALASGLLSKDEFADWLRANTKKV